MRSYVYFCFCTIDVPKKRKSSRASAIAVVFSCAWLFWTAISISFSAYASGLQSVPLLREVPTTRVHDALVHAVRPDEGFGFCLTPYPPPATATAVALTRRAPSHHAGQQRTLSCSTPSPNPDPFPPFVSLIPHAFVPDACVVLCCVVLRAAPAIHGGLDKRGRGAAGVAGEPRYYSSTHKSRKIGDFLAQSHVKRMPKTQQACFPSLPFTGYVRSALLPRQDRVTCLFFSKRRVVGSVGCHSPPPL